MHKTAIIVFLLLVAGLSGCKNSYRIETQSRIVNEKDIQIVQIHNLNNKERESTLNNLLKSLFDEWVSDTCHWIERAEVSIKNSTDKYLSIEYLFGSAENRNGYLRMYFTFNLSTGSRLFLDDFIDNTEVFGDYIRENTIGIDYIVPITEEYYELVDAMSMSEKDYLELMDEEYPHIDSYIGSFLRTKPTFYIDGEYLVFLPNPSQEMRDMNILISKENGLKWP